MPLLKKKPFKRLQPPAGLELDDEVFYCEATKEVFKDYESFFQRTILCNSLVWSCSVTGKGNIKYLCSCNLLVPQFYLLEPNLHPK